MQETIPGELLNLLSITCKVPLDFSPRQPNLRVDPLDGGYSAPAPIRVEATSAVRQLFRQVGWSIRQFASPAIRLATSRGGVGRSPTAAMIPTCQRPPGAHELA